MSKITSILAADSGAAPSRPLALARILVGLAAVLQILGMRPQLVRLLAPGTFRAPYAISPSIGGACAPALIGLMLALAAAAIAGWKTRLSLGGLAASMAFVLALDQQLYRNDLYLLALECFLLCLGASGAALSMDAGRGGGQDFVERWPVLLLQIQLSVVYASTAIAKINPAYLRGEVLQASLRFDGVPRNVAMALAVMSIGVECFLAAALWFRATRRAAMLVGFLLHTSFLVLLAWGPQLVAFELEMLALYSLFPGVRPGECRVVYDGGSPFACGFVNHCRRLDWLRACRFEARPGARGAELEAVHESQRFAGFKAAREIASVLPLTWFLAPALSLPGLSRLGERAYGSFLARGRSVAVQPELGRRTQI